MLSKVLQLQHSIIFLANFLETENTSENTEMMFTAHEMWKISADCPVIWVENCLKITIHCNNAIYWEFYPLFCCNEQHNTNTHHK